MIPLILLHCGLGTTESPSSREFLSRTLLAARGFLLAGESALSISWMIVSELEKSGLFNAGLGAIAQDDGVVRRDVGTMNGKDLKSLGLMSLVATPSPMDLLSRLYGRTRHVLLSGAMAESWGVRQYISNPEKLFPSIEKAMSIWDQKMGSPGSGTVGAVVRDIDGHVAATTSTCGMGEMLPGRIGDSSIPGAGYYADDELGAISMTGHGEGILTMALGIRLLEAHQAAENPKIARENCQKILDSLERRTSYQAGAILLSQKNGPLVLHLGDRMLTACLSEKDHVLIGDQWLGNDTMVPDKPIFRQ
jgi:beta-aspartyl-peptidase (threonine type)